MAMENGVATDDRDGPIYVEIDTVPGTTGSPDDVYHGIETRGDRAQRVLDAAGSVYADGLDLARRCARQAADRFADLGEGLKPDEVELQLSIKLDAQLGAVLVKSGAEAQLQVTFRWTPGSAS
ncbi:CU044_2847 family protein [Streptomyces sp. NPDC059690]|uniref:CU044_2847 family protein n=1 Tax=Streptomyces sp. NPDC059690 TaxID=3346907 RepID=UPI0036C1C22C